ncbi:MAG: hypothetical protein JXR07_06445 [Reichenbachiella sp.]
MLGKNHSEKGNTKFILLALLLMFAMSTSFAQEIKNLSVEKVGDDVNITFDLKAVENPQELYDIEIFSSRDGYSKALDLKSGKVKDVFPGLRLKFVIDAKQAFSGFKGDVDFRIVANLTFVPLSLVSPLDPIKTKPGKSVTIMWKGGKENSAYKLDYSKEGGSWSTIEDNINDNKYTWYVPKKIDKGTYSVKLSSDQTKSKSVYSGNIVVKKTSPFVFIIPAAAVLGATAYFILGSGDDGGGTVDTNNNLPNPPDPPTRTN